MKRVRRIALKAAFCGFAVCRSYGSDISNESVATSKDGQFQYEIFGAATGRPVLILLHGSSGPTMSLYREQAELFAGNGYTVLLPHYFDVTKSSDPTPEHYRAWVDAVLELLSEYGTTASTGA